VLADSASGEWFRHGGEKAAKVVAPKRRWFAMIPAE
jgi:hypothetical protein